MALILTINAVDQTSVVDWKSLVWTSNLTKEIDRLEFDIIASGGKMIPDVGKEVELIEDGSKLFGGVIIEKRQLMKGGVLVAYEIRCKDYSHTLDKKLINKTYTNKNLRDIVVDIITNYTDGTFTTTNIPMSTPLVNSVKFNYEQITKALTQLAEQVGWDWYVDPDKDIHFLQSENVPAPFDIDDVTGKYDFKSLEFSENITNLRNSVYVRGGDRKLIIPEADARDKYTGNGTQTTFPLGYLYNEGTLVVKKNGASQLIGTDLITDPSSVDCLYNKDKKFIRFPIAPAAGQSVIIYGDALIPILVNVKDAASIAAYGEYQSIIIDKSVTTVQEAQNKAKMELDKYGGQVHEGKFTTPQKGLRVGQGITVQSTLRGITKDMKIIKIVGKCRTPNVLTYEIALLASGKITFTDIMVELLNKDKKNLDIAEYEVLQNIISAAETLTITDSTPVITTSAGPYLWAPSGGNDMIWDKFTWG